MTENHDFQPDWVSAPGETMVDILEERNLSPVEFAKNMGKTPKSAGELLCGRAMITIETARKLEAVLGASAAFWMIRESQYREDVARLQREEQRTVDGGWLSELPVKDMIKFGWIEPNLSSADRKEMACLRFFDVPDVKAWRVKHRTHCSYARICNDFGAGLPGC